MVTVKALRALKAGVWLSDGGGRGGGSLVFRRTGDGVIRAYFRHVQSDGSRYALPIGQFDESGRDGMTLAEVRSQSGELSKLYQSGVKDIRAHLEAEEANRKAAQHAAQAAEQAAAAKTQARQRYTLKALCDAYVDHLERKSKSKSAKDSASCFKVHVIAAFPEIASAPAREITPHQVAAMVRRVREAGKERTAGVLRSNLRAAYSLAMRAPFDSAAPSDLIAFEIESNPVDAIPAIPVRAGQRTLTPSELRAYLTRMGDRLIDEALKLALLSGGQRMAQLLRARVNDYQKETRVLRLWDGKGKRSEPREHLVPLGRQAAALVERLVERAKLKVRQASEKDGRDLEPNPPLFISSGGLTLVPTTPGKRVAEISADMKGEPFDLRDIRRTVETMLAGMGISRDTRAQLLSHGLSGVQSVHYDRHSYMDEKRAALLAWEARLQAIENGEIASGDVRHPRREEGAA
jgi:integrase